MKCPTCSFAFEGPRAKCPRCGGKLRPQLSFDSNPGTPSGTGAALLAQKPLDIDRRGKKRGTPTGRRPTPPPEPELFSISASQAQVASPASAAGEPVRAGDPPAENVWSLAAPVETTPTVPSRADGLQLPDPPAPPTDIPAPTAYSASGLASAFQDSAPPPLSSLPVEAARLGDTVPERPAAQRQATLAPAWRRACAWLLDGSVLALVFALYCLVGLWAFGFGALEGSHERGIDWFADTLTLYRGLIVPGLLLAVVVGFVYQAIFAALGGSTPGKRLAGIRVVRLDGTPLGATSAVARAGAALLSFGLGMGGLAWAVFDRRGQALHDKITKTVVVLA